MFAPVLAAFARLSEGRDTVVLAVSGGSDSMALMRLYADYAAAHRAAPKAHILTINHGLRPEAAEEAQFVAQAAAQFGFSHEVLAWSGAKPRAGLQAAARGARHGLLRMAAMAKGADCILLGHNLDDQRETFAMRQARSGAARGLAAMAPATLYCADMWLVRPLLEISRADLRRYLAAQGQAWVEDPSNLDDAYERVRVRKNLDLSDDAPWQEAAEERRALAAKAAAFVGAHAAFDPALMTLHFNQNAAVFLDDAAARLAFGAGLAIMGGQSYVPSDGQTLALLARLAQAKANLAGCLVSPQPSGLLIEREARRITQMAAASGETSPIESSPSKRHLAPFDLYLPSFDLALANGFAPLFGRKAFANSPL